MVTAKYSQLLQYLAFQYLAFLRQLLPALLLSYVQVLRLAAS